MDFSFKIKISLRGFLFLSFFLFVRISASSGQEVEHNYPVGPAKTNCDSLQIKGLGFDETSSRIENTTFRFHQKFKNSRLNGVQAGQFYSCDGEKGFLLLTVDKKKTIFREVPKSVWDSLIITTDPDQFYMEKVRDEFPGIPEN